MPPVLLRGEGCQVWSYAGSCPRLPTRAVPVRRRRNLFFGVVPLGPNALSVSECHLDPSWTHATDQGVVTDLVIPLAKY